MFFKNLNETLSKELPKWVLNYQMRTKNIMRFIHKNYVSFSIEMHYEDKDQLGNNIFIQDVCLNTGRVPTKYWKPIDHILDFNLKVNLPLDLKTLLSGSKINVMEMLRHIDEICNKVAKDGLRLWRLVCQEEAAIVIDSNRIFVKKIEHFIEQGDSYRHPSVRKTEFRIEVNNIRCLSVKDIILPPVYTLSNELQFLPTGIDFIEKIIKSPSKYLKQ
ncbi:unnamed protein product [Ceratitis capitata]|uniref:(Mediterranean fruit fly) hypothetical protein n=2 Tax=Ceratitis capitata TaxID=7213 RepID=A0A811U6A8_CERCA|nr:unnamed protein product [Ceratitis capitata]